MATKAPPPLPAALVGNPQTLPSPTAEPVAARTKPMREENSPREPCSKGVSRWRWWVVTALRPGPERRERGLDDDQQVVLDGHEDVPELATPHGGANPGAPGGADDEHVGVEFPGHLVEDAVDLAGLEVNALIGDAGQFHQAAPVGVVHGILVGIHQVELAAVHLAGDAPGLEDALVEVAQLPGLQVH